MRLGLLRPNFELAVAATVAGGVGLRADPCRARDASITSQTIAFEAAGDCGNIHMSLSLPHSLSLSSLLPTAAHSARYRLFDWGPSSVAIDDISETALRAHTAAERHGVHELCDIQPGPQPSWRRYATQGILRNTLLISLTGTTNGYRVYTTDPFNKQSESREGDVSSLEMLFSTSLVALTLSPRVLRIQNTKRHSTICEMTFRTAILAMRLNRKRLVVVLESELYIYDISNMQMLKTEKTSPNPNGTSWHQDRGLLY